MKLSDKQVKAITSRIRDINIFLSGKPRVGDINAKLVKQWLENLLWINSIQ